MTLMLVDSNYLENPALLQYLAKSRANKIVICEHVMIEQHKTNPALTVERSFKHARQYPKQVLVLKSIPIFYGVMMNTGKQVRKMIDYGQSRHFAKWYDDVLNAKNDPLIQKHLEQRQSDALAEINQLASDVHNVLPIFKTVRNRFTKDELKEIRGRHLQNESTQRKLIDAMLDISRALFNAMNLTDKQRPQIIGQACHYYLFRYAMCVVHLFIRWVEHGNLSNDTDKLVNHIMDMQIAAQATYFNGIMTDDKVLEDVHKQARRLLFIMRGYVPT